MRMKRILVVLALLCAARAWAAVDLTPALVGATVDVQGGTLVTAFQRAGVGTLVSVENFRVAIPYRPSGELLVSPVTAVLGLAIQSTELTIARIALNLKPLEDAGVALPGGFLASLLRAQLETFDTKDIALSIRAGKLVLAAKSGLVHTRFEGGIGWGEGTQLAIRVDALRLNFGLPVPRALLMKRLAFLDPLDWADVHENVVSIDIARLAKVLAESLPASVHLRLPDLGH
jgi:hypothetical protein